MRNARRDDDHIALADALLDAPRVILVAEAELGFAVGYTQDFVGGRLQNVC
jgi:hypothetical protein